MSEKINIFNLPRKIKMIIFIVMVLITTMITLSPCLHNGYCNWDDYHLITANNSIKNLSWQNIKTVFTSGYVGTYIPLTVLSFAIEYKFFKLNPFVSHLINLIFHLLNVVLVFWLIYLLSGNGLVSFIVSLLFGIYPLHVESVAWATERKDMLYSFFYLVSLITYLYYRRKNFKKYYFFSIGFFFLSVLSKPMAVTLPVILLLFDYYFEKKLTRPQLFQKLPYFAIAILFSIINVFTQGSNLVPLTTYLKHFFVFSYNILFYLFKIILPLNLSCFYPFPDNFEKIIPIHFLLSPVLLAALVLLIVQTKKLTNKILFGALFFIITILPVSQIVPLVAPAIAADRYTYIPSIGLFYIAGLFFLWLYKKCNKTLRILVLIFASLIVIFFSFLSYNRCQVWKDSITLWSDVLKKYPTSGLAYNNRGNAYNLLGKYEEAISDFNKAIELNPEFELPYFNRGTVYVHLKMYEKAIADFTTALKINPNFVMGYVDRGSAYCHIPEYNKAFADLNHALRLNPNLAEAYYNLGYLYFCIGQYDQALVHYNKTLKLDPNYALAYASLGDLCFLINDFNQAIKNYNYALQIDTLLVEVYYNRGVAYRCLGMNDRAMADYNKAIHLSPVYAQAYNNRGNIFIEIENFSQAISDYTQAVKINPSYADAYYNRAIAYYKIKEFEKAMNDLVMAQQFGFIPDSDFVKLLQNEVKRK